MASSLFIFLIICVNVLGIKYRYSSQKLEDIYCSFKCGKQNTVCQRKGKCAAEGTCVQIPTPTRFREIVLEWHNQKRNIIATGNDTRGGNSKTSTMHAVSYDLSLEFAAQCWINRCIYEHDKCSSTMTFPTAIGQNLAMIFSDQLIVNEDLLIDAMNLWYDEIVLGNEQTIDRYPNDDNFLEEYGHYSQVVWDNLEYIGCGHSITPYYDNTTKTRYLLICNYYPAGNFIGRPIYKRGEPCSECKKKYHLDCNDKYNGLCGEITLDDTDAPFHPYHAAAPKLYLSLNVLFVAIKLLLSF